MTMQFLYLYDPLCGWCYGASAGIATLAAHPDVTVEILPTSLFAGKSARTLPDEMTNHIKASDQQIAKRTGAVFGPAYFDRVIGSGPLRLDSGPATLALTAVSQSAPDRELEVLGIIQRARYIDGHDIADRRVLADLLEVTGLATAAVAFAAGSSALLAADAARRESAQFLMRRFALSGVPSMLRDDMGTLTPVDSAALYADPLSLCRVSVA